MGRTKQKEPIYHNSSVQDIFYSMKDCSHWLRLLLPENKPYNDFLKALFARDLYAGLNKRVSIKQMAADSGYTPVKVSKWIAEMYEDIFTLNSEKPELFKEDGVRHELYFKNYDDTTCFTLWLPITPRIGERFSCFFMDAKLGTRAFWVSDVHHDYGEGEYRVTISLKSGFPNTYRLLLMERALYFGHISFMEFLTDYDFQMDEKLKSIFQSQKF
jgi:hypothetical protein